ncbi:glycosyltransferase family 8 protein [Rutstroemia sp. NJR-2017a WRK4]|nr:glycosyltransferase family 8 protein [Rutstroemia sp. NJR-2017a WRK4]
MRRSRSTYAFAFLGVAALLYLTLLARPAALEDVYKTTKATAQSLPVAGWDAGPDKKEGVGAAGTEDALKLPAPGALDQLKPGGSEKLSEAPLDHWPHNYNPSTPQQYAYATYLSTRNPSIRDPYFMALQNLIFRVLWSPRTRTLKYPFLVFVSPFVTEQQRDLISGAGAIVRDLPPLDWDPPASSAEHPIYARWKDNFSKLHMWNETDFERFLFLDADAFPVTNIDAMFEIAAPRKCKAELLEADDYAPACGSAEEAKSYVFSAVPQGGSGGPVEVNVGAMVFSTSTDMYVRFLGNYQKYDRYVTHMADQGFMSWQFKQDGAFPATLLDREWDGFFPKEEDKGKLKVVHEKLWAGSTKGWLKEEWVSGWTEMVQWYEGTEFDWERKNDNQVKELLRWSVGH